MAAITSNPSTTDPDITLAHWQSSTHSVSPNRPVGHSHHSHQTDSSLFELLCACFAYPPIALDQSNRPCAGMKSADIACCQVADGAEVTDDFRRDGCPTADCLEATLAGGTLVNARTLTRQSSRNHLREKWSRNRPEMHFSSRHGPEMHFLEPKWSRNRPKCADRSSRGRAPPSWHRSDRSCRRFDSESRRQSGAGRGAWSVARLHVRSQKTLFVRRHREAQGDTEETTEKHRGFEGSI